MKKNGILMLVVTLIMALGMNQSVMAKEKKVKYLGHKYKGEVNKQKVPDGKGIMNVNGLLIEGDFSDRSVSNAEVSRTPYLGTSNTTFYGTITYDESENIVLKAGGVLSTKYYDPYLYGSDKQSYVKDILKEDRIVNSGSFEPKKLIIPFKVYCIWAPLEMPTLCASDTIDLTHAGDKDVFVAERYYDNYNRTRKPIKVKNYKDSEGRIWEYLIDKDKDYRGFSKINVKYPNGSCISIEDDGEFKVFWEIHYPNGKIVKAEWKSLLGGSNFPLYNMGNFSFKSNSFRNSISLNEIVKLFLDNVNKEKFTAPFHEKISIKSDSLDFSEFSNSEMEKFIREEVIPYIKDGDSSEYITDNGKYEGGRFTSDEQIAAARERKAAAENAVYYRSIANFKKKYGFDPSVNDVRYIVKVGRNAIGVVNARKEWVDEYSDCRNCIVTVVPVRDQGTSQCYKFYWMNGAYFMGYFWTRNNIITSIQWR